MTCTVIDWYGYFQVVLFFSPIVALFAWWAYQDTKTPGFYDLDLMSKYNITFPQLKQLRKEGKL